MQIGSSGIALFICLLFYFIQMGAVAFPKLQNTPNSLHKAD